MGGAICKRCGGQFERSQVYSWGLCKDCDKRISVEVKSLKIRKSGWGGASVLFLLLLLSLVVSYMIGTDAQGNYHLISKGTRLRDSAVTPTGLLFLAIVCLIGESIFVPFYFSYRQRITKIEKEAFGDTF